MRVVVQENKKRPDQRIVFIKGNVPLWGEFSVPAYLPKELQVQPAVGSTIEVMISGMLWHRDEHDMYAYERAPRCFFIKEPTLETKVKYDGFVCWGSMCTTTAYAEEFTTGAKVGTITPGRLHMFIREIDTVSGMDERDESKKVPGVGWVAKNPNNLMWRLEGVEGLEQLDLWEDSRWRNRGK